MWKRRLRSLWGASAAAAGGLLLVAAATAGCSVNPATGKRQLALIGEQQEIAMGREADGQISRQLGLYDDEAIQSYVAALGARLAAQSERPHLPWTFRVVDDEVVNAFALPGGFIYVTRGILTHMGSEAELAGVVGHEIGHVTARHGVSQMSKSMLAQIGLGVGSVLSPEVANLAGLAESGLGLLFLKYGRDDERQADELAVRYAVRTGYDPRAMVDVFDLLGRVSAGATGSGDLPGWLLTHPDPGARREETSKRVAALEVDLDDLSSEPETLLRRIDGMVYGADPRQGYFRDDLFLHPELAFELRFPAGWRNLNMRQAVVAQQPNGEAVVALTLTAEGDAASAARAFAGQGVTVGREWRDRVGGQRAVSYYFTADLQGTAIGGLALFLEHGGRVFRVLGYTTAERFDAYHQAFERALGSFRRLEDRRVLAVQPLRLQVRPLERASTIAELARSWRPPVTAEELSLLNNVELDERLERGVLVKRVVGEPPP